MERNKTLLRWAQTSGRKYQKELNELCYEAFNKLSRQKKMAFLNYILDAYDKNLYVVIANSKGATIYKPVDDKLGFSDKITAKPSIHTDGMDVGYTIFINRIPTYRVQTNATNKIGISAFCQRIFKV